MRSRDRRKVHKLLREVIDEAEAFWKMSPVVERVRRDAERMGLEVFCSMDFAIGRPENPQKRLVVNDVVAPEVCTRQDTRFLRSLRVAWDAGSRKQPK